MSWLILIIIGAVIGFIASLIMGFGGSVILDIIIGILGSILGKYLFFDLLHIGSAAATGTWSFWGIFWAVVGAAILIIIIRAIRGH